MLGMQWECPHVMNYMRNYHIKKQNFMFVQFLFVFMLFLTSVCSGQNNARIKPVTIKLSQGASYTKDFLLPPNSKIANEGFIFHKRSLQYKDVPRFRYQYIFLNGISARYDSSIQALRTTNIIKKNLFSASAEHYKKIYNLTTTGHFGNFVTYYLSSEKDKILFEIDYSELLSKAENFNAYVEDLYKGISNLERDYSWPISISQNIIQKFRELTPVPQDHILDFNMAFIDKNYSYLLLNPGIWLLVDNAEKVRQQLPFRKSDGNLEIDNYNYWSFNLNGQSLIKFYRDENGGIMESPFTAFSQSITMPTNSLKEKIVLQSSTADIQFSEDLKNLKFVSLFQNRFKRNNQQSDFGDGKENTDNSFRELNSFLVFSNCIDDNFIQDIKAGNPLKDTTRRGSVFGMRNLITPVIPIFVNEVIIMLPFNSDIFIGKQLGQIPPVSNLKVYRIYNGSYKRLRFTNDNLLLLPDDKICF